jgi:hypothetical protein
MVPNAQDIVKSDDLQLHETSVCDPLRPSIPSTILLVRPLMLVDLTNAKGVTVKISDLGVGITVSLLQLMYRKLD